MKVGTALLTRFNFSCEEEPLRRRRFTIFNERSEVNYYVVLLRRNDRIDRYVANKRSA